MKQQSIEDLKAWNEAMEKIITQKNRQDFEALESLFDADAASGKVLSDNLDEQIESVFREQPLKPVSDISNIDDFGE